MHSGSVQCAQSSVPSEVQYSVLIAFKPYMCKQAKCASGRRSGAGEAAQGAASGGGGASAEMRASVSAGGRAHAAVAQLRFQVEQGCIEDVRQALFCNVISCTSKVHAKQVLVYT